MYEYLFIHFFFFKQKTADEMRISDWSSDVCSSDLAGARPARKPRRQRVENPGAGRDDDNERGNQEFDAHGRCPQGGVTFAATGWRVGKGKDRKSVVKGKSVSVRLDLGGRRTIKKNKIYNTSPRDNEKKSL